MDSTKRVIILNKLNSPAIAQAIFILKDSCTDEFSAVCEAERIVAEFMEKKTAEKRRHSLLPFIVTALFATGIALALIMQ